MVCMYVNKNCCIIRTYEYRSIHSFESLPGNYVLYVKTYDTCIQRMYSMMEFCVFVARGVCVGYRIDSFDVSYRMHNTAVFTHKTISAYTYTYMIPVQIHVIPRIIYTQMFYDII